MHVRVIAAVFCALRRGRKERGGSGADIYAGMSRIADAPVGGELDRAPTNRFAHCRVSHVLRLRRKNAFVCMFIFT